MSEIKKRVLTGEPLDHIPVIDSHTHLDTGSAFYICPHSTTSEVVEYMDRFGVDHWFTFPLMTHSNVDTGNRYIYSEIKNCRDRFSALCMLHAQFPDDWKSIIDNGEKEDIKGIKLISGYQGRSELDIDWSPALEQARGKGWVVLNHSWGSPERLKEYAEAFPDVTFINGHLFGNPAVYKPPIEKCDNVFQCTCAHFACSPEFTTDDLVNILPYDKILYGSDALDLDFGTAIGPIALADIPEETKEAILGRNSLALMQKLGWELPERLAAFV